MPIRTIKKIVLCGGGIKCLSILSALKELVRRQEEEESPKIDFQVNTYKGCSMGAVLCLMFVLNKTVDEIIELIMKTRLGDISQQSFWTLFRSYGLDDGTRCVQFIDKFLESCDVSPKITLERLHKITGKTLQIAVTNLNQQRIEILDHINNPTLPVSLAIRMSISFPFYFTPVELNNCLYVDGGVIDNFPFDEADENDIETLGFIIKNSHPENKQDIRDYTTYASALVNTLFLSKEEKFWSAENVVCINLKKFYSVMSATNEERLEMIEQGRQDGLNYLDQLK